MASNEKKLHILTFAGFVILPFFLARVAHTIFEGELHPILVSTPIFTTMKAVSIIFSIVVLVTPWLINKGIIPFQTRNNLSLNLFPSEYRILILGYIFIFTPVVYGLFLLFFGMPLIEFYYYLGVSIVGTLLWGFVSYKNLTKSSPNKH